VKADEACRNCSALNAVNWPFSRSRSSAIDKKGDQRAIVSEAVLAREFDSLSGVE
jgi:hypothetical protein